MGAFKDKAVKIDDLTERLALTVEEFHEHEGKKPGTWSALAGQYLVYGLERSFGFAACAHLCAQVERTWMSSAAIRPVIKRFLMKELK